MAPGHKSKSVSHMTLLGSHQGIEKGRLITCHSPQLHPPCSPLNLHCPLTSLAQHHLAYLTCTLPVSLLTHSPCSCHPITPLTLSPPPILLTPPALLPAHAPPVPSHLRPSESAVIKPLYPSI